MTTDRRSCRICGCIAHGHKLVALPGGATKRGQCLRTVVARENGQTVEQQCRCPGFVEMTDARQAEGARAHG